MTTISDIQVGSPVVQAIQPAEVPTLAAPMATVPQPVAAPVNGVTAIDGRNALVRDKQGRSIKVKRLGAVDRYKLFLALGAEASENRQAAHYANIVASAVEIDGAPVPFPATALQVQALVSRLDDDGIEAILAALISLSPEPAEGVAVAAKNL